MQRLSITTPFTGTYNSSAYVPAIDNRTPARESLDYVSIGVVCMNMKLDGFLHPTFCKNWTWDRMEREWTSSHIDKEHRW